MIKDRGFYLEKRIRVTCDDGKVFEGLMQGMGSSDEGLDFCDREEEFIEVGDTVLFDSQIAKIEVIE